MISHLKQVETPPNFSVMDIFKNATEQEAAEQTADFFTKISHEFEALTEKDIPRRDGGRDMIKLSTNQVYERLKECKQPKGLLAGDIFPQLLTEHASLIVGPLTDVINAAFDAEI